MMEQILTLTHTHTQPMHLLCSSVSELRAILGTLGGGGAFSLQEQISIFSTLLSNGIYVGGYLKTKWSADEGCVSGRLRAAAN